MRALSEATAGLFTPLKLSPDDLLILDVSSDAKYFNLIITDIGHTGQASNNAREVWLQRIPDKKRISGGSAAWQVSATDWTACVIQALWPANQITFASKQGRLVYQYLLLTVKQQENNATAIVKFKELGEVPELKLVDNPLLPLTPYQHVAGHCLRGTDGFGLFMEMGCGKTAPVIAKICNEAAKVAADTMYRALIVCPKNVRRNWFNEIERFSTTKGRVRIIQGGEIERITTLLELCTPNGEDKYAIGIIGYESMVRSMDVLASVEWDLSVLDEAHYIKKPETKRAKAAFQLRDTSRSRVVLTGSPVSNTPLDLYSLFEFMGQGWSGFSSWWAFKDFYGVYQVTGNDQHKKLVDCQNLPFMQERIARLSYHITKKEAMPYLPEMVTDTYEVEMNERQTEVYRAVAEELFYETDSILGDGEPTAIEANNILTRFLRLAQIASGYAVYSNGETEYFDDNPKLNGLVDMLSEKGPNDKTIIWSSFVPCIKQISALFDTKGFNHVTFFGGTSDQKRIDAEHSFNYDKDCKVFLGNPAAGGVGLNLLGYPPHDGAAYETNANHVIYYVCDWSLTKRIQSEARSHRKGTRQTVRITDLVVPETIDEEVRIRVNKKRMMSDDLVNIRELLRTLLKPVHTF